jgi:hypothetical protein
VRIVQGLQNKARPCSGLCDSHHCDLQPHLTLEVVGARRLLPRIKRATWKGLNPRVGVCDENMFAISLLLKDFGKTLVDVAAGDSGVASVRVNICRTGVLNIFITVPGGADARTHLDETLMPVPHRLFAAIARVV